MEILSMPSCYVIENDAITLMRISLFVNDCEDYTWYKFSPDGWMSLSQSISEELETDWEKIWGFKS